MNQKHHQISNVSVGCLTDSIIAAPKWPTKPSTTSVETSYGKRNKLWEAVR
ncbi:hypothetical protein BDW71DRAFT_98829 [Aspergillus fruticulosus]